jgi:hypothetical protein
MKINIGLIRISVICTWIILLLASSGTYAQTTEGLQWGQPSDGIQMSLSLIDSNGSDLQVAFRNVGDHDVTLNLGTMMANGKVQLPDNVSLMFTDAEAHTRVFKFFGKVYTVDGRVDDYVVPLRAGSMYTLKLALDQFWCEETKEFEIRLLPGKNQLTAKFQGSGAKLVNLDMPAIKLMNFWLGKAESNTVTIGR